jgi:adenylate kinase family enzyme
VAAASNDLRIVVIGSSCSGKTTFAHAIAEARRCPRIELDELFWGSDWTPKPRSEFLRLVSQAAAQERWVAAGNYGIARPALWARATTIVWLDYSFARVLWRGLKRTVVRCITGEPLYHGNRESFRRAFLSRDSILLWIVGTFARRRREFAALRQSPEFAHLTWLHACHPREAGDILRTLASA